MDVKTKVSLYTITPDGYTTMDCEAIDYSASENALTIECQEIQQLYTALNMIDAARAEALREIETVHIYLDECYINDPDQGRAVPLVDRVVLLVSRWAKADGEATRLRDENRQLKATLAIQAAEHWALLEKTGDW